MTDQDEYADFAETRTRRTKVVAWIVIAALILMGGGATVLSLLFG
ncbi:hypothetical protein [Microbacterium sp.]